MTAIAQILFIFVRMTLRYQTPFKISFGCGLPKDIVKFHIKDFFEHAILPLTRNISWISLFAMEPFITIMGNFAPVLC